MTTIIVNSVFSEIQGYYPNNLDNLLSFFAPGYKFSPKYKAKKWDGKIHLLRGNKFPTGLLSKVEDFLYKNRVKYEVIDNRDFRKGDPIKLKDSFEAWEHQTEALKVALDKKCGIFAVATSGGKTNIASMIVAETGLPTIFLTHLKGLLHQTAERFENLLSCEIGVVGDGLFNPKRITIASIQTVLKHIEKNDIDWLEDYKVMICDEVHHLSSSSWTIVCSLIKAPYRFGLSGTVTLEGNGMLLEAYTGPILYDIKLEYLENNNLITPFNVKIIKINTPIKESNRKLVYAKVKTEVENIINSEEFKKLPRKEQNKIKSKEYVDRRANILYYQDIYEKGIVDNKPRNEVMVKLVNHYYEKGLPTLVLFRYINHGKILSDLLNSENIPHELIYQKTPTDERIRIKNDIENGKCKVLVASSIFDEGENLPSVSVLLLAGGEKGGQSGRRLLQRIGRVLRLAEGKTEALIYDFYDNTNKYLKNHSDQRLQVYKTNNIKHSFVGEL